MKQIQILLLIIVLNAKKITFLSQDIVQIVLTQKKRTTKIFPIFLITKEVFLLNAIQNVKLVMVQIRIIV